jgi:hypothetical protein
LREAAVHKQFRSSDVAAVVGCEEQHGFRDLVRCTEPAERDTVEIIFKRCRPSGEEASRSCIPGVSMEPGLTAFTRMRRSSKSVAQVRANERMAAFVAL